MFYKITVEASGQLRTGCITYWLQRPNDVRKSCELKDTGQVDCFISELGSSHVGC